MKKLLLATLAAAAVLSTVSVASAQYYGDRPYYRERHYDGPRHRACPYGYFWARGYGCVPNCHRGYRWHDGACRPYHRGY